jgi:hypothetical protein
VTASCATSLGINAVYLVGNGVFGSKVAAAIPGSVQTRLAGTDRLLTSIAVADYGVAHGWGSWDQVGVTTGWNYPDALAGGPWLGKRNGLMLLTNWLYMQDPTYFKLAEAGNPATTNVTLFGGTNAVSPAVMGDADDALIP